MSVRTRVIAVLVAASSVIGGGAVAARSAASSPAPAATPVILVRGYAGWNDCPGSDVTRAYWGDVVLKLADAGWQAPVLPVSFYVCDSDGVDITGYGPVVPPGASATITPDAPRAGFTADSPLRHIAHDLAWFVYAEFTRHEMPVDLVGFSMGGLLIRYALYRVAARDPDFPPLLYVSRAVTVSTPHAGLQTSVARSACGTTRQCRAMRSDSAFMTDLTTHALDPEGRGGTSWTVTGSSGECDLVPASSALAMPAAKRVRYVKPCYAHGDYLWDYSDEANATMRVTAPGAQTGVTVSDGLHVLAWLTRALRR